jgi:hypothetical protein
VFRSDDYDTEARRGQCGGLAGHRAAEALALERCGQVHRAAAAKEAGKEVHGHVSMQKGYTGCLRCVEEWGISFAAPHIGARCLFSKLQKRSG